ncbi:MAG: HAD family hydrolase [Candidatus Desulfofervidaceae bacterium]|nr:HAD family hydrolase [Candidatus Desulfofervidaceae bacterium]
MKKLNISIPGLGNLNFKYLVLDLNGTLALDGKLLPGVTERLQKLNESFKKIYVITADTHGTATEVFKGLPVEIYKITSSTETAEKQAFVKALGSDVCIAIGNGANDALMLRESGLGICVLGKEAAALSTLLNADVVVQDINDALDLLLFPKRLVATLRK